MKAFDFFKADTEGLSLDRLRRGIITQNIRKGRILALFIMCAEVVFAIIDLCSFILKVDNRFHYLSYFLMYLLMILVNLLFCLYASRWEHEQWDALQVKRIERTILVYATFIMTWGGTISLMDQKLYGQMLTFTICMISCAAFFYFPGRQIFVPFTVSSLIVLLGLPFFQKSSDILIGHYVNLSVLILVALLSSNIMYRNYCDSFKNRILLEKEIEQNARINNELSRANHQLRKISAVDELTGVPNRRGFRNFVDHLLEEYVKDETTVSAIMADIDFFKEYNDTYGHIEGDRVLVEVANQISLELKNPLHFAARWGGEEFLYIAFNTKEEEIFRIAESIRKGVLALKIPHGRDEEPRFVSVSIGTSTLELSEKGDIGLCIELADKALYEAKTTGRNRVKSFQFEKV